MKKVFVINVILFVMSVVSCNKANLDQVSLTASTTQASVGQTVSVTLTGGTNASSWTVTPSVSVSKQFSITTQKVNYFTFSQPACIQLV